MSNTQVANPNMSGKICMVTGANSGIGLETVLGLAEMGATVVMVCRNQQRGEIAQKEVISKSGNNQIDLLLADLSSQQSIRQLAEDFKKKYQHLHLLVNNAGGFFMTRKESVDGQEMTFALNHLAPFLLTNLLLDTMRASTPARVVTVSSDAHQGGFIDTDDLQAKKNYKMFHAYGQSKLSNILFTYALARRLADTGITANCLHPGVVATNIWRSNIPRIFAPVISVIVRPFMISPEEGARTSLYLATSLEVEGITGKYFYKCRTRESHRITHDEALQEQLWQTSAELTRLTIS